MWFLLGIIVGVVFGFQCGVWIDQERIKQGHFTFKRKIYDIKERLKCL